MTEVEKEIRAGGEDNYTVGLNGVAVVKNTFWQDFTIAERISGHEGVEDTFKRAFEGWRTRVWRWNYNTTLTLLLTIYRRYIYEISSSSEGGITNPITTLKEKL